LEHIFISQQQPSITSHEPYPNQPLVYEVVGLIPSSVDPILHLESGVNKVVGPIQSLIDPTLPLESEVDVAQVFLTTSDYSIQGGISPVSMAPPPNTEVISFDWNILTESHLPSYLPFQIIMQFCDKITIHSTIFDEGTSVSIISSTSWQDMGSPQCVSVTHHLWDFNIISSKPLGILPQLPITLGGKTVCIDVIIVHDPLNINFLLG
jgi:hypothetical protein